MTSKLTRTEDAAELRRQAEGTARQGAAPRLEAMSTEEIRQALHELRVHQIELEMQNEELRRTQEELDASQARYCELYDLAPVGYVTVSEQGLILDANLAAAALLGVARGALVGRRLSLFILPDDQGIYYDHRQQLLETGVRRTSELRMLGSGGTVFWVHLAMTATPDAEGVPVCYVTLSDITERKQTEDAMRDSERATSKLLDRLNEAQALAKIGSWEWDLQTQQVWWSEEIYQVFGVTPQDYVPSFEGNGKFIHPDDLPRYRKSFEHSLETGERLDLDVRLVTNDGVLRHCQALGRVVHDASGKPISVVGTIMDITERKLAEDALRLSEARFRSLVEHAGDIIYTMGQEGIITYASPNWQVLLGHDTRDVIGQPAERFVHPDDVPVCRAAAKRVLTERVKVSGTEYRVRHRDGTWRWHASDGAPLPVASDGSVAYVGVANDITERRRAAEEREKLEAKLRQSQKLESVGRLAGGVAHEFNNKLMGIMGYVELCRDELPPEHPVRGYLDEITTEAKHSAGIAKQLLAYARKQVIAPKVLDVNDALAGMLTTLRHLMGAEIAVSWMPGTHLWPAKIDPGQLDQILANLCVNARDAIAGVGKVTIETANIILGEAYSAAHADAVPGEYVKLAVSDTGCGIGKDVLAHIFDPFFTTKEVGKGTGLGLATVHGIVEQKAGHIEVRSEVGKGTTFSIYLPRAASEADLGPAAMAPPRLPRGTETILLAENEKSVRVTARLFLEALGYTVLAADTPEEAQRLGSAHPGPIHLLITDVVMPGMNGPALAGLLAEQRPHLKCLFMSGYTAEVLKARGTLNEGMPLLSKPFSRDDLARQVRAVLDGQ
jgi:PAS domain S-box-containing protein